MTAEPAVLDVEALRGWIGRRETASDLITPRLEASLRSVFDRPPEEPALGEVATTTIHWCLTPAIARMTDLGEDGHPRRGGFMPPVPLPRRMWAGSDLAFKVPLLVGDTVTRESRIDDVVVKTGRSGTLCFVTVRHVLSTARGPAVEERQDIVFRGEASAGGSPPARPQVPAPAPRWHRSWTCDPVLLFRYSALTFNGHRIHYDRDYAMRREGYPDLVVHGPLQAAALLAFACEVRGAVPCAFAFRGMSPLFAGSPVTVNAAETDHGLRLWTSDGTGRVAMQATAGWA